MNLRGRVLAYAALAGFGLSSLVGCPVTKGPIDVDFYITPAVVPNHGAINLKINVKNLGLAVRVNKVEMREKYISGVHAGQEETPGEITYLIAEEDRDIPALTTSTILDFTSTANNYTGVDEIRENTITVYTDGGSASDTATYTSLH